MIRSGIVNLGYASRAPAAIAVIIIVVVVVLVDYSRNAIIRRVQHPPALLEE
jgi:hypothetical protein